MHAAAATAQISGSHYAGGQFSLPSEQNRAVYTAVLTAQSHETRGLLRLQWHHILCRQYLHFRGLCCLQYQCRRMTSYSHSGYAQSLITFLSASVTIFLASIHILTTNDAICLCEIKSTISMKKQHSTTW
jgi:hypothetical protein